MTHDTQDSFTSNAYVLGEATVPFMTVSVHPFLFPPQIMFYDFILLYIYIAKMKTHEHKSK
jgi:hypothetical protein